MRSLLHLCLSAAIDAATNQEPRCEYQHSTAARAEAGEWNVSAETSMQLSCAATAWLPLNRVQLLLSCHRMVFPASHDCTTTHLDCVGN